VDLTFILPACCASPITTPIHRRRGSGISTPPSSRTASRRPTSKFQWAMSKLPASLMDTIGAICDNTAGVYNPYVYCKASCCGPTASAPPRRPLLAGPPRPGVQQTLHPKPGFVLFSGNCPDTSGMYYKNLFDFTQWCNEVWECRGVDASAISAAPPQYQACSDHCSSSLFWGKQNGRAKFSHRHSPIPAPARGGKDGGAWCYYHNRYGSATRKCQTHG
jgi:hypothetical protein